ncbi:hypothetical protein F5X68DRAFT_171888 [Plectosphaerella plurivora]|uniref:Zn(2)-C6 fungal-type domain-containing protein n=1 Tax=Plectosphaerella plurivora TaxID=936078 RepID=A0A9P9AAQ8_9PEZI|nr:hypothetical protein F5X68DRAFT_171888 [Plectosphaerella plurivora]
MSNPPLRPLLPVPAGIHGRGPPPPPSNGSLVPRRTTISAACNTCRSRKAKCSGERPACSLCRRRKLDCLYETDATETHAQARKRKYVEARSESTKYAELVQLLQTRPMHEVQDILGRLRAGVSVESILSHVETGDLLVQLAVTPEARLRYEFPYIVDMPAGLLSNNPYLESMLFESSTLLPSSPTGPATMGRDVSVLIQKFGTADYQSPYLKPIHAAEVIEPRLSSVKPSQWTSVSSDDTLMRQLLATFFRTEYLFNLPFQKDLFLEDMAAQRTTFCSSLLVNAVMSYCCACHQGFQDRSEYWNPSTLSYRFMAEAKRLWELEAHDLKITTIHASIVLETVHAMCGLDKIGKKYSAHAQHLAREMRLMEGAPEKRTKREKIGWAYTAWTMFSLDALAAFHFRHTPHIKSPPAVPMPDPTEDPSWYGEVWVKYPLAQTLSRVFMAHMFRERCRLRTILAAASKALFEPGAALTPELAGYYAHLLDAWYHQLPECLRPRWIVHPTHFQLHIEFHHAKMTLYQPLLQQSPVDTLPLTVVQHSTKSVETLLRVYYLRHGFDALFSILIQPLTIIAFACLDRLKGETSQEERETLRSTLFLVTKGFVDQGKSHYLGQTIFRLIKSQMQPEEAALMKGIASITEDDEAGQSGRQQAIHSLWPAGVMRGKAGQEDVEASRLSKLVQDIDLND